MFKSMLIFTLLTTIHATAKTLTPVEVCLPSFREELVTVAVMSAKDQGVFARHGLDVRLRVLEVDKERPVRSVSGSARPWKSYRFSGTTKTIAEPGSACQFGTTTIENVLLAPKDTLAAVEPIMISAYGTGYDTHLVVPVNSKIKSIRDLKGKQVRIGQAPNALALQALLKAEGLSLKDITQVYRLEAPQVLAALERGSIDAAITYVPTMPYMLATGKVRMLSKNIISSNVQPLVPHSVILVKREFARANADVVARMSAALNEAAVYLARNPSETVYTFSRNSKFLGYGDWPVSKVTAERAGELVGRLELFDLRSGDEASRQKLSAATSAYAKRLVDAGFMTNTNDLTAWLQSADTRSGIAANSP